MATQKKNAQKCFFYPDFSNGYNQDQPQKFKTALLNTVHKLYDIECNNLLKFGFRLNYKTLYPTSLEKQNVISGLNISTDIFIYITLFIITQSP